MPEKNAEMLTISEIIQYNTFVYEKRNFLDWNAWSNSILFW